jgi:hypothetical protein
METHQPDPTSEEPPDPWETASADINSLGNRLKETYRRVAAEGGPTEDEVKEAFATLVGAWDQVANSFSTALNDPDTRAHLKRAASSFAAALGATITGLGEEINGGSATSDRSGDETVEEGGPGVGVIDGDREPSPTPEADL